MKIVGNKASRWMLFWAGLSLLSIMPARAEPPAEDLQSRLEKLEQRNQQLERVNEKLLERLDRLESGSTRLAPVEAEKEENGAVDNDQVKKIVTDYLKTESDKKKAEAKKLLDPEEGFEVGKNLSMTTRWNNGLWGETQDKAFRVHVGGRAQYDAVWMKADDEVQNGAFGTGRVDSGVNPRRGRFTVDGTLWEVLDFWCEYEFVGNTVNFDPTLPLSEVNIANSPGPTDMYIQLTHLPIIGNIRMGNQKPPISFEHLTSSRFLNFMERSLGFDAFIGGVDNGFNPGIMVYNWLPNERATWAIGAYKRQSNVFGWNVGDGDSHVTGRVTYLPIYENDGRCLVHLGLGASHRDPDNETVRIRSRSLLRNGPFTLQTVLGDVRMLADREDVICPELVAVWGPWTFQAEYYGTWVQNTKFPIAPGPGRTLRGTAYFPSYYAEVLYFLTGEHRVYDKRFPRFDRVVPHENFFCVRNNGCGSLLGRGAWQVGVRYSYIDIEALEMNPLAAAAHDVTLGLNWFLNPSAKIQWNYMWEYREVPTHTSDGVLQGFGMRFALDF